MRLNAWSSQKLPLFGCLLPAASRQENVWADLLSTGRPSRHSWQDPALELLQPLVPAWSQMPTPRPSGSAGICSRGAPGKRGEEVGEKDLWTEEEKLFLNLSNLLFHLSLDRSQEKQKAKLYNWIIYLHCWGLWEVKKPTKKVQGHNKLPNDQRTETLHLKRLETFWCINVNRCIYIQTTIKTTYCSLQKALGSLRRWEIVFAFSNIISQIGK